MVIILSSFVGTAFISGSATSQYYGTLLLWIVQIF